MCMCRINLWLIFSETFAAAAGGGETCLMCNQRDVFLPAGSRPSVRRHMMHVLHLPNLPQIIADFSSCFLFSGWNSSLWPVWGFDLQDFCADVQCAGVWWWWWWCEWCGESAQAAATLWCETARLLPARREEGKEWKMWIEH